MPPPTTGITHYGDGVDGAPNGIRVPRWSLSSTHLKEGRPWASLSLNCRLSRENDAADATAICEAAGRPGQRFVPVRSIENQAELMRHRARELLAGQRTSLINALRGHMAEIGVVAPQGAQHAYDLKRLAADGFDENGEIVVPDCVRAALRPLVRQIDALDEAIAAIDKELAASVKADETAKRLMTIPGVGPDGSGVKGKVAERRREGCPLAFACEAPLRRPMRWPRSTSPSRSHGAARAIRQCGASTRFSANASTERLSPRSLARPIS